MEIEKIENKIKITNYHNNFKSIIESIIEQRDLTNYKLAAVLEIDIFEFFDIKECRKFADFSFLKKISTIYNIDLIFLTKTYISYWTYILFNEKIDTDIKAAKEISDHIKKITQETYNSYGENIKECVKNDINKMLNNDNESSNITDVKFYYMLDNHTFHRLGKDSEKLDLDKIIEEAIEVSKKDGPWGYGMLCGPIFMSGDNEVSRLNVQVHASPTLEGFEKELEEYKNKVNNYILYTEYEKFLMTRPTKP